jgi:hypothetical protein
VIVGGGPFLLQACERTLFDHGCHVISLDSSTFSSAAFPNVLQFAMTFGVILLIPGEPLDAETKLQIASCAGTGFFDLMAAGLAASGQDILQRMLAIADSLRIVSPAHSSDKVN